MDTRTGDVYRTNAIEELVRAEKAMKAGEIERLVEVREDEIERLQNMSRQQRRAELRKRPAIEKAELERLLKEARTNTA